jgi:hypothetical protein
MKMEIDPYKKEVGQRIRARIIEQYENIANFIRYYNDNKKEHDPELKRDKLQRWFRGETMPRSSDMVKISQILDTTTEYILEGKTDQSHHEPFPGYMKAMQYPAQDRIFVISDLICREFGIMNAQSVFGDDKLNHIEDIPIIKEYLEHKITEIDLYNRLYKFFEHIRNRMREEARKALFGQNDL